jgi:hypothetical protein
MEDQKIIPFPTPTLAHSAVEPPFVPLIAPDLLETRLEVERRKNGKRFSTYYEAYGRVLECLYDLSEQLGQITTGVESIWVSVRNDDVPSIEADVHRLQHFVVLLGESAATLAVVLEKLMGGVLHEPKI